MPETDGQAIGPLQIDSNHVREFPEAEFHVGTQVKVAAEDGANRTGHSKQEDFRIQASANSYAELPSAGFPLDIVLQSRQFFRRRSYVGWGLSLRCWWGV